MGASGSLECLGPLTSSQTCQDWTAGLTGVAGECSSVIKGQSSGRKACTRTSLQERLLVCWSKLWDWSNLLLVVPGHP